jgi:mRNA-degrading endonuclease RelE of RelBE toxin-antitoxin system
VKIEWTPAARASARRYMADQDEMRAIGAAVAQLTASPYPPEAFHRSDYHRLRVGPYRVLYFVDGDLITMERVDRLTGT